MRHASTKQISLAKTLLVACATTSLIVLSSLLGGCDVTEEDVEEAIENANYCNGAGECIAVYPGCPLGCHRLINAAEESEIRSIIDDYFEDNPSNCEYDCVALGPIRCEEGQCVADTLE